MAAGQVKDLVELKSRIRGTATGMAGKDARRVLSSLDARIALIRRGAATEEEIAEAQMEAQLGQSVGPLSDSGLEALGIVPDQKRKEDK